MQITKPRTQRKKLFQAPAHIRYKHFSAPLSPDLKEKYGTNAFPVKVGDTVRIMRGDRKGFEGKVSKVNRSKYRIFVDGVTRTKVDGSSIQFPIHPSKTMIINLEVDDKWRKKALERKGVMPPKKKEPSPAEAVVAKKKEEPKAEEAKATPKRAKAKARKPRRKKKAETEPSKEEVKKPRRTAKTKAKAKPRRRKAKEAAVEKGEE
jgi:large subunit ribosomal protein L24